MQRFTNADLAAASAKAGRGAEIALDQINYGEEAALDGIASLAARLERIAAAIQAGEGYSESPGWLARVGAEIDAALAQRRSAWAMLTYLAGGRGCERLLHPRSNPAYVSGCVLCDLRSEGEHDAAEDEAQRLHEEAMDAAEAWRDDMER